MGTLVVIFWRGGIGATNDWAFQDEYLSTVWDRDQEQADGSEASDVLPASTFVAEKNSGQTKRPDYR